MNNSILYSFLFVIFSTLISINIFYHISKKINLIDKPNFRKNHEGDIPLVGGLSILISLIAFIFIFDQPYYIDVIIFVSLLILLVGIYDDIYQSSITIRILIQFIASILIIILGLKITTLGEYFYFGNIQTGYFGIILTLIFVVGLTNSINFIDGLDGLAAGIVLLGIINLFIFSFLTNPILNFELFTFLIISLLIFIIFNLGYFKNKKIFLGDSGSTTLGFILGWFLVYYSHPSNNNLDPSLTIWCVSIPVFDLLALLIIRFKNNKNPLHPDHNHIHHTLLRLKFSQKKVLTTILCLSVLLSLIGYLSYYYFGSTISLIVYIFCFIIYLNIRLYHFKKDGFL